MTEPPEQRIAAALERLGQVQRVLIQDTATASGLSPLQVRVLLALAGAPARPSELAARLGVTRATLTDSLQALRAKGLCEVAPDEGDGRSHWVGLTASGRSTSGRLASWGMPVQRHLAALPPGEQGGLLDSLLRLIADLQRDGLIPPARMCLTCRFYRPDGAGERRASAGPGPGEGAQSGAWCDLLAAPLTPVDLRLDCLEHEPAGA